MLEIFAYGTVAVVDFTDQNWISKTVCIRCLIVCKIGFPDKNAKIALLRASMVVTYYIKLFETGADIHNGILMSLLLLVTKTTKDSPSPIEIWNIEICVLSALNNCSRSQLAWKQLTLRNHLNSYKDITYFHVYFEIPNDNVQR